MAGYSLEFQDINGDAKDDGAQNSWSSRSSRPGGCFVSNLKGFFLLLLAIVLAVGVGVIVVFARRSDSIKCTMDSGLPTVPGENEAAAVSACQEWIESSNTASAGICSVCPSTDGGKTTSTKGPGTGSSPSYPLTTDTPPYPRDKYRLPSDVIPNHYNLRLQPNMYGPDPSAFTFEGSVTIDVTAVRATHVITLHVDRLTIKHQDVTVIVKSSGSSVEVREITYEEEPHFYHIHLVQALRQNEAYQIRFAKFTGPLKSDDHGLYLSSYRDGDTVVYLATTQFEAPYARKAFPCFDEPALKATFDITLVRKTNTGRNYRTLSNMDIVRSDPVTPEWTADVYNRTMVMPTYLLAFIVCDYKNMSDPLMGITYSTWARPNAIQYAERAQEHGLKIFHYYESRFNPPYSTVINKLDNIAIPDFAAGAMENWGLITYREALLYKPGVASASDEYWIATVISHEIAHMWFGNIVSPKWWHWLWLNEAFASFWDFHCVGQLYPDWRTLEVELANGLHAVMTSDSMASSHPMTADVETRAEVSSIFDAVTYTKGSFIIRMMHFIMGEDKFIEALNIYIRNNEFGDAEHKDLWEALDEVGLQQTPAVNMTLKMDPWVTQMGYPVVMATRTGSNMLKLSQQRFLLGSEDSTDDRYKDPPYDYQWEIPITMATSQNPNFDKSRDDIMWLHKNQMLTIADPTAGESSAWFLVNVQQYGYYRVNYDQQNWDALISQLKTDHSVIHPINRGQLINDAWNLVKAELLDMSTALRLLDYLGKELDYVPWRAFANEMDYVALMLDRSDLYGDLENFIRTTVGGPLQSLGLEIPDGLPVVDTYVRALVAKYACSYGHTTCVNLAKQLFSDWISTGTNKINANLRQQFYCTAVKEGGQREWAFAYDQFKAEDDARENSRLRSALACTREPSLLRRVLEMSLDPAEIRPQDIRQTIQAVAANRWGRDTAFHFVVERFPTLVDAMSASNINRLIASITAHFNSPYHLTLLKLLEDSNTGDSATFQPAINAAKATLQANSDWLKTHRTNLQNWLRPETEPEGRISYRLPHQFEPSRYTVRLQPHIYGTNASLFFFEGSSSVVVRCLEATDVITLHVDNLDIQDSAISVKQENSPKELFVSTSYEKLRHFYRLHLSETVQVGKTYILQFSNFTGPLTTSGRGFYLSYYKDGDRTVYLATTQMEPPYARKTFPCFDEPGLKAVFDITLVRRNDTDREYMSLTNTALQSTSYVTDQQGKVWAEDQFLTTPIMPTYLLAFIVSDFKGVTNTTTSHPTVLYSTYARPNGVQWAGMAQEYGLKLYDWMDTRFKPSYGEALSKLDNVAVPDFNFGAMENWGLIIYREAILYQPGVTSARDQYWTATVVAHELAHMWFGDYVSPKWWNYLWLNEAFASWWDVYVTEQVFGNWRVIEDWVSSSIFSVLESDALATSHPMTSDVQSPSEIMATFDGVTYNKGSHIIRMMHFVMGLDTFVDGLNLYLNSNRYGNADTSDLWAALDQKMKEQHFGNTYMTDKMDPWVTQMGFPVVKVTRTAQGYHLTQDRFLIGSIEDTDDRYKDAPYDYQWEIPIIYATKDNDNMNKTRDDIIWLSKNSQLVIPDASVNDTESWILFNIDFMAYYRVLYDNATWQALIGQLKKDRTVIPTISRAQIINDAWNLARAGLLEMSVALSTLDFLQNEVELAPWRAFAREMDYVELMLERTDLYPDLKTFMQETVSRPLNTLTLDITEDMVPVDVFVRTLIAQYSCSYGLLGCVNEAKRLFAEWKNTDNNRINANLRSQFYCTAVAEGDSADWEFVYNRFKAEDDTTELNNLRHALSCSRDLVQLRRLLNMAIDPNEIRAQDVASTIQWVARNPVARDMAFQFFVDKFEDIGARLEGLYFGRVLTSVTSHFNTEYSLQQLQRLSEVHDTTVVNSILNQALAQTRANIAWLDRNYPIIKDWLTNRPVTQPPPAEGSYRLPQHVKPVHYDLRLQPHIYGTDEKLFYFEGEVSIRFTCVTATKVITLHQDRLTINDSVITVKDFASNTQLPVAQVTQEPLFHFYKVHLTSELTPGRDYVIHFPHFRGDMRKSMQGLYLSSYTDNGKTIYLATTQMEATYTRQAFPCFDEPGLRATFTITLVRKTDTGRDYISLSNMPLVSTTTSAVDPAWAEDVFQISMRMPTYLLAFVVCDYKYLSGFATDGSGVETRTYARPNRIQDADTAQGYALELFEWFNTRFLPPYQNNIDKVYHIAIPDFAAGAMENWGLITYRENLLYNSMSTASTRRWIATVISHELAHMWFGNNVSPKWWDSLWLNEAFASYWEVYAVEDIYPSWKSSSMVEITASQMYAMQLEGYPTSHPLTNPVETPAEIDDQFDTITYTKGGAIIAMMHMIMGRHFIPSLNVYLQKMQLSNADHSDLLSALDEYCSTNGVALNMTDIMEPWVTQMGFPVVNVHRDNNQIHINQTRFLYSPESAPADDLGKYGYKFEVPITYTTSAEKEFNKSWTDIEWLHRTQPSLTIALPDANFDWVLVNLRHQGYYRVNYDLNTWKAIISQLNTDHLAIHEVNRAAIIDDAWNLVRADMLPMEIALQTIDYMSKETEYGPWRVFVRETDMIQRMVERTDLFADFKRFMQSIVEEPLKTLGFDVPASNIPPVAVFKRTWIIGQACDYDSVTCVTKAKNMVSDWMNGLGNAINVNLRSLMYCSAVKTGSHAVWNFFYDNYRKETDATEKSRLRNALGCSKDPTILMTFLEMCLYDDDVPQRETQNCVNSVANNRFGRDVALNFFMEHFPTLQKSFSSSSLGSMLRYVTQHFHTNYHLAQLQFLEDTYDVSGITRTIKTVRETTVTNMKWLDKNRDIIRNWLAAKVPASGVKINYRLPTSVTPSHYTLFLHPDIYHDDPAMFTFSGNVTIRLQCLQATSNITIHGHGFDLQEIKDTVALSFLNGSDTGYTQDVTYDELRQFLVVVLNTELVAGEEYMLFMQFSAPLPGEGVGLYYTSYKEGDKTVYLATTKFEAPYARRAFPCFDEPAMKATFDITLIRRQTYNGRNYNSKSNNALKGSQSLGNGVVADSFETTLVSPTYLLAFIVSDFECLENLTDANLRYRTCARPAAYQQGRLAQDYGVIEMNLLEDLFDPPYNMSKLENMAIPDFLSGAMENWGLITYRETLLYEEGVTTASAKDWIVEVVAHELTHMWYGNVVSPKWWNWLWLNEAFASYWDFHLVEGIEPTWRMTDMFVAQSQHSVMADDSLLTSHPLTADVESPSEIQAIFDSITYSKGAAIVRMMSFIMGENHFVNGSNVYLNNHQYSVAQHQDFFQSLDEYSASVSLDINMTDVMTPWVTQMNFPVVKVTWSSQGQITVTQQRFLSSSEEEQPTGDDGAPFGYRWDIPITISTSTNRKMDVTSADIHWLRRNTSQAVIQDPNIPAPTAGNWLLVNVRQYGFYRVNYDPDLWLSLIAQLEANPSVIPAINRAQIINDAWSFAKTGQLNMSIALRTLDFLKNDDDYVPWRAIAGELSYIDRMLSRTAVYGLFEAYMVSLVNETYQQHQSSAVGWDTLPPIDIFQRQRIMGYACNYGIEECKSDAMQKFQAWKNNPTSNSIPVDMRSLVYCNGIRFGSTADWEFVLTQYKMAEPGSDQDNLRSALACSRQPWLLQRLLDLTLETPAVIPAQDARSVVQSVASNPVGRDLAFPFVRQHYDRLTTSMTPSSFGRMVVSVTQHFNQQHQLDEVRQFMSDHDVSNAQSAFRNVVEQTTLNMGWMKDHLDTIETFLTTRS